VFINIGGLLAPFVAPLLRQWWLGVKGMVYNAQLPALCHKFLNGASSMTGEETANLNQLMNEVNQGGLNLADMSSACSSYLEVFNTGVHYSFIASVAAMIISLAIFLYYKKGFPTPAKKAAAATEGYTPEEKKAMAKEIKQRMAALFAVLAVCIFFWLSFHQNGQSLSVFARDYVITDAIAPEIWQAVNPFFVIVLTPIVMWFLALLARKGKAISTPRKIVIGMGITAVAYFSSQPLALALAIPTEKTSAHSALPTRTR